MEIFSSLFGVNAVLVLVFTSLPLARRVSLKSSSSVGQTPNAASPVGFTPWPRGRPAPGAGRLRLPAFGGAKTGIFCHMGGVGGTQVTATASLLRSALHSLGCAEVLVHCQPQAGGRCCRVHQKWVGIFCKPGKTLASLALTYLAEKTQY